MTDRVIVCIVNAGVAELYESTRNGASSFAQLKVPKDWSPELAIRWAVGTVSLLAPAPNGDTPADHKDVKRAPAVKRRRQKATVGVSSADVLDLLHKAGPMTNIEIRERTGLDVKAASNRVNQLRIRGEAVLDPETRRWSAS